MRGLKLALPLIAGLLVGPALLTPPAAAEQVYWQQDALLADMFPTADRFEPAPLSLSPEQLAAANAALGYTLPRQTYTFLAARQGPMLLGWVLIDEQVGQHEPITFAVQIAPDRSVIRHEVVVYRERYGAEVRDRRFRAQFVGKTAADPLTAGRDIRIVSGATYSSKAMAVGVKRAVVLASYLSVSHGS